MVSYNNNDMCSKRLIEDMDLNEFLFGLGKGLIRVKAVVAVVVVVAVIIASTIMKKTKK